MLLLNRRRAARIPCVLLLAAAIPVAAQAPDATAETPCLQQLKAEQVRNPPKPKKQNLGKILVGVGGAVGGGLLSDLLCNKDDARCRVGVVAAGAGLGVYLGAKLDKQQERKLAETAYAAALTGKPAGVTFAKSCALIEPLSPATFERRQVQIAVAPGVAPPADGLRTVAEYSASTAKAAVPLVPQPAGKSNGASPKAPPGSPMFVMGSVSDGRILLVGDGSQDLGYVARGYAPAAGWQRVSVPAAPQPVLGPLPANAQQITLMADVPCRTMRQVFRQEDGKKAKQQSADVKYCTFPDGSALPIMADS